MNQENKKEFKHNYTPEELEKRREITRLMQEFANAPKIPNRDDWAQFYAGYDVPGQTYEQVAARIEEYQQYREAGGRPRIENYRI